MLRPSSTLPLSCSTGSLTHLSLSMSLMARQRLTIQLCHLPLLVLTSLGSVSTRYGCRLSSLVASVVPLSALWTTATTRPWIPPTASLRHGCLLPHLPSAKLLSSPRRLCHHRGPHRPIYTSHSRRAPPPTRVRFPPPPGRHAGCLAGGLVRLGTRRE